MSSAIINAQAVQFTGSTTSANAIDCWISTGVYKRPQIVTCDLRHSFTTEIGNLKVNNGDYVVKDKESGIFRVMTPEEFNYFCGGR